MKKNLTIFLIITLLVIPLILCEQLKAKPLFYENILIFLLCYYMVVLRFILYLLVTLKNKLVVIANLLPIIGMTIGYILNRVYKANCSFKRAIIIKSEVCDLIFVAEKFIYLAIYIGFIVLLIDIVIAVRKYKNKHPRWA